MASHLFHTGWLTIHDLVTTVKDGRQVSIPDQCWQNVDESRDYLYHKLQEANKRFYGINTGFGALADVQISSHELGQLQENLLKSHAAGSGDDAPYDMIRLMLLLKIQGLLAGFSGVNRQTIQRLVWHYNADVLPVIYEMGSLGASGDLAPLAHLSLPLIGRGEVWSAAGKPQPAHEVLTAHGLHPLRLEAKEGLSLLNGTQFMTAYGTWCLHEAEQLLDWADTTGALSLDSYGGKLEPFHRLVQQIRQSPGQEQTARNIRELLADSPLAHQEKAHTQDPYAFRCIPQVHGAAREAVTHVKQTFEQEINAVTDNPNIFSGSDEILSGGNFHGERLALTLDYLAMALSEIGSIAERRIYKLLSGDHGLPEFLVLEPGLNSGLMIPQYTAASLVSQNRQLCTPASVDSITSSNGQEDHVSMGANAAVKTYQVLNNVRRILSIELLTAAQALDFRRPQQTSTALEALLQDYRQHVPFFDKDQEPYPAMQDTEAFIGKPSPIAQAGAPSPAYEG